MPAYLAISRTQYEVTYSGVMPAGRVPGAMPADQALGDLEVGRGRAGGCIYLNVVDALGKIGHDQ